MMLCTTLACYSMLGQRRATYSHIRLLDENHVLSIPPTVWTTSTCRTIVVAMTLVSHVSWLRYGIRRGTPTYKTPVAKMAITANRVFVESCKDITTGIGKTMIMRSVRMLI